MIAALADLYIRSRNIVRNFRILKSRTYFKFVVVWDLDTHTAFEANPSQTHERKGKHHSTKARFFMPFIVPYNNQSESNL